MTDIDRRNFLAGALALATTSVIGCKSNSTTPRPADPEPEHGLGAEEVDAPTLSDGRPALRVILKEADGSPLSAERMRTLHARDLNNDPLPQAIVTAPGRARIELNRAEPIQVSCRLNVPGFGEVYCYSDNDGKGYTRANTIEFSLDAARTRIRRVGDAIDKDHTVVSRQPLDSLQNAALLTGYESLVHSLRAGEQFTLERARHRISRFPKPRDNFKFGVLGSGFTSPDPVYIQRVRELFDFGTVSWYAWRPEVSADVDPVDYTRMDAPVDWCLANNITPKIFGYLYMVKGATPDWIRPLEPPASTSALATAPGAAINTMPNSEPSSAHRIPNPRWPYDRVKSLYARIIRQTTARYAGRVQCVEVMNEAHDKANLWGLNHEQILDMARMAFDSARQGDPNCRRMMNHCCMWAEYAKNRNRDGSRRWSPHQFIKTCFDNGINYETIGLQLYYPQLDLFEIDRMLDRFTAFGKPIHITELATASQDGLDPQSLRPQTYAPGWHGPWSQVLQADWAEAIYTLCYSKPQIEVVGWWDLTDSPGHFWPFGGLLDANLQPKESYIRLQKLRKDWELKPLL